MTRTRIELARRATGLVVGAAITPAELGLAEQRLQDSRLFRSVRFHTRRGSAPGHLSAVFVVEEAQPHFRFGLGLEDVAGWYLIPIELNFDNLTGRAERASISTRFGLRTAGFFATLQRPRLEDPRHYWQIGLRSEFEDRLYFFENVEVRHRIERAGLDLRLGRGLPGRWRTDSWLSLEAVDADSSALVHRTDLARDRREGDRLDFSDLPAKIQGGVSRHGQSRLGLSLTEDGREGRALASAGHWIRLQGEWISGRDIEPFFRGDLDFRRYVALPGGTQLALRSHFQSVGSAAPFFERPYLGGLYSVRGYPSESLSPPEGDLHTVTAGVEFRGTWIGRPDHPRLVGLVFVDGGWGWQNRIEEATTALGIGYGVRLTLPWIGRLGIDIGHPLSDAPVDDSFHINAGLGWTF